MDTKQPEALRIADDLHHCITNYGAEDAFTFAAYEAEQCVRALHTENEILHAENESLRASFDTLRTGYDAARLEIASLRERVQQLGQLARDVNSRRVTELEAQLAAVAAPKKWAPEEVADGGRGIRWVTNEGVHGRPTDHDVREYLKRTPTANGCHCDDCKRFYAAASDVTAAPAQAGEYPPLVCDYCGALTPDPWHSSGMLHGKMSKHIHSCDACAALATPTQAVQQDAERYRWLRKYAIGAYITVQGKGSTVIYLLTRVPALDGIGEETDKAIDAARATQEGKHD